MELEIIVYIQWIIYSKILISFRRVSQILSDSFNDYQLFAIVL